MKTTSLIVWIFKPRIGSNIITAPKYDGFLTSLPFVGQHFIGTYDSFDKRAMQNEMSKGELAAYKKRRRCLINSIYSLLIKI